MPSFEDLIQLVANGIDLSSFNFETADVDMGTRRNKNRSSTRFKGSQNLPVFLEGDDCDQARGGVGATLGVNAENFNSTLTKTTETAEPTLNSLLQQARLDMNDSPVSPRRFLDQYMTDDTDAGNVRDPFQDYSLFMTADDSNVMNKTTASDESGSDHSRLLENVSLDVLESGHHSDNQGRTQFLLNQDASSTIERGSIIQHHLDRDRVSTPNSGLSYFNGSFEFGEMSSVSAATTTTTKNMTFENSF